MKTLDINHPADKEKRLKGFVIANSRSDYDGQTFFKLLRGRLTKKRYKVISGFCRKYSFRVHCGHEHDCCGCLCNQRMNFVHSTKTNKTLITISFGYNY